MIFLRSAAYAHTGFMALGLSLSLALVSCQSPTETQGAAKPVPGATIAPTVTYRGDNNTQPSGGQPGQPAQPVQGEAASKTGPLAFKIKLDRRLLKGFGIQQLSNCAQDLTQIETTLTLSSEVSAAAQSALEQQGITVTNQNGQSTLTFNNTLAEVDQETLEISYNFSDLPQGAAIAQTVVKDSQSQDFGFVDYNVTVNAQGASTLNVSLNATDTLSRVISCPQLAAEVQGGSLNATGGDIVIPVTNPTPTTTPTPTPTPPPAIIAVVPTLTQLSTTSGPPATKVIITGTGLETVKAVTFGGKPAFEFTIDSETQITAYSTSTNPVAGTIKVINPAGAAESTDVFTPQIINNRRIFASPTGGGDGSSWSNALSLRYALGTAQPGDEVWVKAGTHTAAAADGNKQKSFVTNSNVKIYGGFAGTETQLSQRDAEANFTLLSADLNGNDDYTDNSIEDMNDNAFHVFVGVGAEQVHLEGVSLEGGFANGLDVENRQGGGLWLTRGSMTLENVRFQNNASGFAGGAIYHRVNNQLTLKNVHFENNAAAYFGGGIYSTLGATGSGENVSFVRNTSKQGGGVVNDGNGISFNGFTFDDNGALYSGGALYNRAGASPLLENGTFENNQASNGGAVYTTDANSNLRIKNTLFKDNGADNGGAIYNYNYASPTLESVRFKGNIANFLGGAMYNYSYASPQMERIAFSDNTAAQGGALYNRSHASPEIINAVFHNNIASGGGGGGIYNYNSSSPKMVHLTFYNNLANAQAGAAISSTLLSEPKLISSIIWDNSDDPLFQDVDRQIQVVNSTVKGIERANTFGFSNLNLNPFFVDASSPAGPDGVFMTGDDGLRLTPTSPPTNFGSTLDMPATDILGAIRVSSPDQGAYEGEFDGVLLPLQIEDLVVGTGSGVGNGDVLVVDYVGTIQGGNQFDSSYSNGVPFTFTLGAGSVIPGWEQGLQGMRVGGKRRLIVPPHLGYGSQWSGQILPNSTLVFEIELIDVNP